MLCLWCTTSATSATSTATKKGADEGFAMKILVCGYYGFANTGDEAICLAITTELRSLGHEVVVLSNNPVQTEQLYGVKAVRRMHPLETPLAVLGCDLLLSGGGGLLQDKTSSRTLTYYLGLIGLAKLLGKRVAVFNQSIGPLSETGRSRVASGLRGVTNIVRDTGSLALLESLGLPVQLGGDPALLLAAPAVQADPNQVLIAPREGQAAATDCLVELAKRLVQHGKKVLVLGFQPGWDDDELKAFDGIANVQTKSTDNPHQALAWIAQSGAVVGVRLHAVILAAAARVPFYGIAYDPKVQGFCRDAGALELPIQFDVGVLERAILDQRQPDWQAVEKMQERARASFGSLVGK
jgi:polysaccharide pyruvyl transferase CsaB